jgi:hypothetical protein
MTAAHGEHAPVGVAVLWQVELHQHAADVAVHGQ